MPQTGKATYHKYRAADAIRQIDLNASLTCLIKSIYHLLIYKGI